MTGGIDVVSAIDAPMAVGPYSHAVRAMGFIFVTPATNAARGEGHIMVKFTPAGSATEAFVDKGPLKGTPVAKCIAKEFKKARVPAFAGDGVQVGKSFRFE